MDEFASAHLPTIRDLVARIAVTGVRTFGLAGEDCAQLRIFCASQHCRPVVSTSLRHIDFDSGQPSTAVASSHTCTAHDFLDTGSTVFDPTCRSPHAAIVALPPIVCVEFLCLPRDPSACLIPSHPHAATTVAWKSRRTWMGDRNPCRSTSHCSLLRHS
jgi:hypothetical protein